MRHGYPYATPAQMGVENEQDAYLATKLAIQCILLNRPTSQIRTYYRGGQDPVAGLKLADITRRGNKVVDAIYNLVNYARTSNETPTDNTILNISKVGDFKDEGNNITQTYSVSSTTSMASYSIRDLTGFPSGSFTADMNGNAKTFFSNGENFKVVIPKSSITGTINGEIMILAHCETYSIYYGEGPSGFQNYALYPDPYQDISKTLTTSITPNTAKITIVKVDKDTKEKLSGVTFNAKYENGQNIGDFTTDANGVIEIKNLMNGTIILTETKTKESYKLKVDKIAVELNVGESKTVEVENEKMKGKIRVIKVDQDNNQVKLEGVTFQVTNSKGTVVDTLTTNANGEATTKDLPINDTYKVKETNTKKEYVLSDKVETVTLKENEIKNLTFTNEKKKAQIKVIKVDLDNNEVKLENVEFEVLDSKGNVVDTIKTDKNGEAVTKRLPIDETYKVRETNTRKEYVLSDKVETVTLKQDEIKTLTFTNEKHKGQLRIIKVDKDNNEVLLEGVKFQIKDKTGKVVDEVVTDKKGEATTKRLPVVDEKYTVVEIETQKEYVLTEETQTIELKENEIKSITFENEKIKGKIQINKTSANDNKLTGDKAGTKLEGAKFEIYDAKGNLADTLITDKDGKAISKLLVIGEYTIKETESGSKFYLVNTEEFKAEIKENLQVVNVDVKEESVDIDVGVKKTGFKETQSKDTIYYDFSDIINKSNVSLDNFTWKDTLPTNALTANKIYTGTWNEELEYSVWYKTNLNDDYVMLVDGLKSTTNNEVKFTDIEFRDGEFVTDFEFRFGTVKSGFREVEKPRLYCDMKDNLGNGFVFTNHTMVSGNYEDKYVEDKDDWTTITYYKDIKINEKLPKTGF